MEWIPATLILLVLVFYGLFRIYKNPKTDHEAEAFQEAEDIKGAARMLLDEELAAIKEDRNELEYIKSIKNDEERLKALADYGNRRRQ